jgi:hypothetical protein
MQAQGRMTLPGVLGRIAGRFGRTPPHPSTPDDDA